MAEIKGLLDRKDFYMTRHCAKSLFPEAKPTFRVRRCPECSKVCLSAGGLEIHGKWERAFLFGEPLRGPGGHTLKLLWMLWLRQGQNVAYGEIADWLWPNLDETPLFSLNSISVRQCQLRKILPQSVRIKTWNGQGLSLEITQ